MSDANIPQDLPGAGAQPGPGAQPGQGRQPTEEEVREYLAQLRQTDVTEIVAQAFSMLASGAEVKLGRRDGRLLIDAAAAVAEVAGPKLDERLAEQMEQALSQLREGQIDAEEQLKELRDEGKLPEDEEGDLPREGRASAPEPPSDAQAPGQQPPQQAPQQGGGSPSDRLWVPGR